MFNGYNETPLISYEFTQDRVDKKQENASKWSYGHEVGVQPAQIHPGSRQPEFWSGKANFVGLPNVKCSCTGCYPSSENQSYQGDNTCHRPWLPRTFPVPLNGSSEPYKLPAYQWDGSSLNQGTCYPETNTPFLQENGGKHALYRHYQESRLPEPNQPGVITSLKNAEFGKKQKEETPSLQNGIRQPVLCNPIYNLAKRADGRNYCDPNEKYSNAASFSVDQHIPRLPVVEPYIKAVPSNLSQNRVPSTGYRSVKENAYLDTGYGDSRKMCTEQDIGGDKRSENYPTGALPSGVHMDCSNFGRDLPEAEPQKLFFDNGKHSDYYSKKNFQNVISRNNQPSVVRKDCVISQIGQMSEQQYGLARNKYQETGKPSCETFYTKNFDKTRLENHIPDNSPSFQRNEDKNENMNVHARLTRSALIFNDPRFADRTQTSFPYQNNPAYRNYVRPEYPCQGYNAQHRYEYPPGFQRNDCSQYRGTPQPMQTCDQFIPQQGNGFGYDPQSQQNPDKTAQFYGGKNVSPILMDSLSSESGTKPSYLEPIRSDALNKNSTNKISPLRLLRKKKFINVPHEPTPAASTLDAAPGLDVRKFWSTWAEEEEESVTPTQMVVLDCQNIDPEQAKLLHLYENDPVRTVQLESGSILIKGGKESAEEVVPLEEITVSEDVLAVGPKNDAPRNSEEPQQEETNNTPTPCAEPESASADVERVPATKTKHLKLGVREEKKAEVMDKWTEKKFDFLKRSEESKAAEILRHEQEKKKIFETRLSLQQSLKKMDKPQEKAPAKHEDEKLAGSPLPFDENSQSSSPCNGNGDMSNLPTSEYRRNKFLDYSDRKVLVNGKDEKMSEDETILYAKLSVPLEADEVKKENIKLENELSTDVLFPLLDGKLKDKPCYEMDDILQKMSEINFQNSELKLENGTRDVVEKKLRSLGKKVKKRKSDQPENDQRADKLTLETVRFSIQKSHDLKISFKVLNNSKKCSDEELGSKDAEAQGNPIEDSPNSTELITLKYKSIQRDGDRRPISESKKNRRRFRRKKNSLDAKTPVLKIRKSRYLPQLESDPLANDENDDKDCNEPKKPYSNEYSTSDDFHVHETVDSAKIKLTFKRHKTGFGKQYKLNSMSGSEPTCIESENHEKAGKKRCRKKSRRTKGDEIFAIAGVKSFHSPEIKYDIDSDAESISKEDEMASATDSCFPFESRELDEDAKNSATSQDSCAEEENYIPESTTTEIPPDSRLATLYDDEEPALEGCNENSTPSEEREESQVNEDGQHQVKLITDDVINENEASDFSPLGSGDENSIDSTSGKAEKREKREDLQRKGIGEISLDFISSTNSEEIEINEESGKTEETDPRREENNAGTYEENVSSETAREIIHSEIQQSSCLTESVKGKSNEEGDPNVPENSCEWKGALNCSDGEEVRDDLLSDAPTSPFSLLACGDEEGLKNCEISRDCDEDSNEVLPDTDKSARADAVENTLMPERKNESGNLCQSGDEQRASFELPSTSCDLVEDFVKNDSVQEDIRFHSANSVETTEKGEPSDDKVQEKSVLQQPEESEPLAFVNDLEEDSEKVDLKCDETGIVDTEVPGEEEKNTDGVIGAEECFHSENDTSQKDGYETECAADDTSPPETVDSEASKITVEDLPKVELSNSGRKKFSREENAEKASPTIISDDAKNTVKGSKIENEQSTVKNVADEIGMTSPKNSKNTVFPSSTPLLTELETDFNELKCEDAGIEIQKESRKENSVSTHLPVGPEVELEEGEIIDSSSDELEMGSPEKQQTPNEVQSGTDKKQMVFTERKIERRHSAEPETSDGRKRERRISTWSKIKFLKAKSCPREMKFTGGECKESDVQVAAEAIPLPMGPPPKYSCFDFKKFFSSTRTESNFAEAKEKPKGSGSFESVQVERKEEVRPELLTCESSTHLQNGRNPSDANQPPQLGIFQRSSKIKFSISRRSKFSKLALKNPKDSEVLTKSIAEKVPVKEEVAPDKETDEKDAVVDCPLLEQNVTPAECQSVQVPNANIANGTEEPMNDGKEEPKEEKKYFEQTVELLGEDLEENIEVIAPVSDYMRDEFYEFEDIPTSEDLTNGDDLEIEKVNDDKFRNIMQNCLDNAKKFLNVGNLKLFSCSVDDLLELDCQAPDSALEEQEAQPNHISRDVLLASCEDTNDDLGLSENTQPPDLSMDFVPSLCSDVCPEILPVDNWPYLEEEVPSSPTKSKQDEADLIPSLETTYSNSALNSADVHLQFYTKNGMDRRKRVISESCFKRFRRRSLMSEGEAIRMCSKIGAQRRSTVDSFSRVSCEKEIHDIKSELLRWRKGKDDGEKQSLKCRLSLEKLKNKHGINFKFKSERMRRMSEDSVKRENGVRKKNGKSLDYKSPSWQPKVMLFRISKNEVRKLQRKSKSQKRSESTSAADSAIKETPSELEIQNLPANKKPKLDCDAEKVYLKLEHEGNQVPNEDRLVGLSGLGSIKGSLSVVADERKRRKSRFRNLYSKSDLDVVKDEEDVPAQKILPADSTLVDAEAVLAEMFRDCDRVPNPQVKSTKQVIDVKSGEKPKKKSSMTHSSADWTRSPGKIEAKSESSPDATRPQKEHQRQHKQRDKSREDGDKQPKKGEHYKHKDRHKDGVKHSRHESNQQQPERSKHSGRHTGEHSDEPKGQSRDRSRSSSGGEGRCKSQSKMSPRERWSCEVCGFDDAEERVTHIKNHPFHCQSCHLAFKTEAYFVSHLTKKHKNIRNQHHCLLCELSFDTEDQYQDHLETREHRHLESVEKNTINTLFTLLTGAPCPVLGLVEMKPEWLPNQAGTVHFYHQATPLSLALQYLKMHHDLTSFSTISSTHPD